MLLTDIHTHMGHMCVTHFFVSGGGLFFFFNILTISSFTSISLISYRSNSPSIISKVIIFLSSLLMPSNAHQLILIIYPTDRVETRITAHLRDQLGTAKNANEMFRIFSRFNALFVRPHIRGAIREYQTQLIQRVKDDIEALHEKFKVIMCFIYPSNIIM